MRGGILEWFVMWMEGDKGGWFLLCEVIGGYGCYGCGEGYYRGGMFGGMWCGWCVLVGEMFGVYFESIWIGYVGYLGFWGLLVGVFVIGFDEEVF